MAQQNVQSMTSLVLHIDEVGRCTAAQARVRIVIRREVRKSSVRSCRSHFYRIGVRGYTRASLSNMSISRFLDVRFLRRYFTALILAFAVGRFIRLPGGGRSPVNKASVTRRLAAVFIFWPDKTSPAIRTPVFNAPLPKATAPLLMSGMALRNRLPNRLPSP